MTAEKELLKRLEYTSSEEEFLEEEERKENHVDLNRRKSKMGRCTIKTYVKQDRGVRRKSHREERGIEKIKHQRRTRSNPGMTKDVSNQTNILKDVRRSTTIETSGFITNRRLTAGISGIFGNSKASDVVRRKGRRTTIEISKRKMPVEVQEQVNRKLERIVKETSLAIRRSSDEDQNEMKEFEEDDTQSPSVCEDSFTQHPSYMNSNAKLFNTHSSSVNTKRFQDSQTPKTDLSAEVPFTEISRRLKNSLIISDLFPGKGYFDELKDELQKTLKQHVSILKKDDPCLISQTPSVVKAVIPPISVSRRVRKTDTQSCTLPTNDSNIESSKTSVPSIINNDQQENAVAKSNSTSDAGCNNHALNSLRNSDRFKSLGSLAGFHASSSLNMLNRSPRQQSDKKKLHGDPMIIQSSHKQPTGCSSNLENTAGNTQGFDILPFSLPTEYLQLYQQQKLHQHQQQQDSGTFTYESIPSGHEQNNSNNRDKNSLENTYNKNCNPYFNPRRKGRPQKEKEFPCNESSNHRFIDHDYAVDSSSFDILDYAGELGAFAMDGLECSEERTRKFPSCVQLPKKPCLDSPSSPFKLYRRKMF